MPLTKVASSMLASGASGSGGSTGKNYISSYNNGTCNGDFESGSISGWSVCSVTGITNGVPTSAPTIISSPGAGDPALSLLSTGQLAGQYSLQAVFPTTSLREGFISDVFTIDSEDQAKILTFKFYYNVTSGAANGNFSGTSANTFIVAVYAVNGTNVGWVQPAGLYSMTQSSGGAGIATGTFQTYSDTTQYRFAILCAVAPTPASITVAFDDFQVGPLTAPIGAPVTDWQSYTMTITATTTNPTKPSSGLTVDTALWRRVGDSIEIMYDFSTATPSGGNDGSGNYLFSLPPGIAIDYTKVKATGTLDSTVLGQAIMTGGGGVTRDALMQIAPSNQTGYLNKLILVLESAGTSPSYLDQTSAIMTGANARIHFKAEAIPVSGWSSNVQMSNDTDTRVVGFKYRLNSTYAYTSGNPLYFDLKDYDTHGGFTVGGTTAAGSSYTVPVSGIWSFSLGSDLTGTPAYAVNIKKNGVSVGESGYISDAGVYTWNLQCNAGEIITVTGGTGGNSTSGYAAFSGYRLSGPSVVAATESVNANYYTTSTGSMAVGTPATVVFGTKVFDSHGAYNSTTGIYTVPVSGKYQVNATITSASTTQIQSLVLDIMKNGSTWNRFQASRLAAVSSALSTVNSAIVAVNAGDTIEIRCSMTSGTGNFNGNAFDNNFTIARVGN